jgi:hypothetical protein
MMRHTTTSPPDRSLPQAPITTPIGQVLVQMGLLTDAQRQQILDTQQTSGRPFGELAEELFGIAARGVEQAWVEQYSTMTRHIDPTLEHIDPAVLPLVSRRQAWQFRILPMRYEGGQLLVCTTREHLVRALNFTTAHIQITSFLVLTDPEMLGTALMRHYPMDGMSPATVNRGLDREGRRGL